ncbi:MAG: alpha/beta fold hydrolase [Bacillota bacterium]
MIRKYYTSQNLRLSYLDNEQEGKPILICLHGHFGNARYFAGLMEQLGDWHVYSIDQRGHGWSEHAETGHYEREDYIQDVLVFIQKVLNNEPVVILGHSLGGINAYQIASRCNDLVKGLIIEEAGAIEKDDASFAPRIVDYAPTLKELGDNLKQFKIHDSRYFLENAVETENGWCYRFDKSNLSESQKKLNGNWWDDFLNSSCPTILLHGKESWVVSQDHIEDMASKRKNTKFVVFSKSGHTVNLDEPQKYFDVVNQFLDELISTEKAQ